jgi:hypothetical protein
MAKKVIEFTPLEVALLAESMGKEELTGMQRRQQSEDARKFIEYLAKEYNETIRLPDESSLEVRVTGGKV